MAKYLFNEYTGADVEGNAIQGDGAGKILLIYADSFGGGSITIQLSTDNTNWSDATYNGEVFAVNSNRTYLLTKTGQGFYMRAKLAGSSGVTNLTVKIGA